MNCFCAALMLTLLTACGQDDRPKPKLFQEERAVLDKAKTVEGAQQQQDQQQRKAIEQQTQ
jgi:uncharacterized membrane protein YgcG